MYIEYLCDRAVIILCAYVYKRHTKTTLYYHRYSLYYDIHGGFVKIFFFQARTCTPKYTRVLVQYCDDHMCSAADTPFSGSSIVVKRRRTSLAVIILLWCLLTGAKEYVFYALRTRSHSRRDDLIRFTIIIIAAAVAVCAPRTANS